jgi:hypothetical protein
VIPPLAPKARLPYPALIASVGAVIRRERALRWTMALGHSITAVALSCLALAVWAVGRCGPLVVATTDIAD